MATEAALLGTPAIRCNSFVGSDDMSNFKLLENKYHLLHNIRCFADLSGMAVRILNDPDAKQVWQKRRLDYFQSTTDINAEVFRILETCLN